MAESFELAPSLETWVADNLREDLKKVYVLTNEESKKDPPEKPYRSLYAARELLSGIKAKMDACTQALKDLDDFNVLRSCVYLELGLNYINTDELGSGEKSLETCLKLINGIPNKVKTASVNVQAYNQLGILWGNRNEQQKALEYLLKSKAVYESHIALPPPLTDTQWLLGKNPSDWDRECKFENLHTLTLFYLAQVYGNLKQSKLSAQYCQTTLSRQLETREYDSVEWSLNCSTLSQYYLTTDNFAQARHCLAAASFVLGQYRKECGTTSEEAQEDSDDGVMKEKLKQTEADISRCWTKYCVSLLVGSRDRQEAGTQEEQPARRKLFKFDTLEVDDLEASVPNDLVESYEDAKPVFLVGQKHVNLSKEYYSLENFASEHVCILQDHSQLYKLLAYFEPATEMKCRMHKRRIDLLTVLMGELNPQYYLNVHRQILYEVAEAQSEMARLKIVSASDAPSPHAIGKVNKLLQAGIQSYQKFLTSFYESGSSELPDPISEDYLRPILNAKLYMARLYSQIILPDPAVQKSSLQSSLDLYKWLVAYCERHKDATEKVFEQELAICKEMVELVPYKIAAIQ